MRTLIASLILMMPYSSVAQEKKRPSAFIGPYTNLKVLKPDQVRPVMLAMLDGLGQLCDLCHVEGDWASDNNPKKNTARMMIEMADQVNAKFPDGKVHVTCYTCHRGETQPKMQPPSTQ